MLRFKICRKEGNEAGLGKRVELKSDLVTPLFIPTEALEQKWLLSDAHSWTAVSGHAVLHHLIIGCRLPLKCATVQCLKWLTTLPQPG